MEKELKKIKGVLKILKKKLKIYLDRQKNEYLFAIVGKLMPDSLPPMIKKP